MEDLEASNCKEFQGKEMRSSGESRPINDLVRFRLMQLGTNWRFGDVKNLQLQSYGGFGIT